MTDKIKNLTIGVQTDWGTILTDTVTGAGEKALQPYSSAVWEIKILINEDGTMTNKDGNHVAISTLTVRFIETYGSTTDTKKNKLAGETYIIQGLNDTAKKIFYKAPSYCTNFTLTTYKESELNNITTFAGANPEIGTTIAMNIVVVPMNDYIQGAKLKVTRDDYVVYLSPIAVATVDGVEYKQEWGTLVFQYTGINAQCMGDDLTFELVYDNKTVASYGEAYSIKQYAINQYENASDELKAFLRDMLVYGAEAQKSIGYKTDALVTEGVEWAILGDYYAAPEYTREIVNNNATSGVSSATLNVSYVNKVRFTLVDASKVKSVTINGTAAKIEGKYVYTDAIKATDFGTVFELVVTTVDDQVITVRYNANAYIAVKMATSNLAKSLNNYGQSAVAYANA